MDLTKFLNILKIVSFVVARLSGKKKPKQTIKESDEES